ncbi:MAG TPA: restriction endonuclease subunit S [Gemmataceae bacterium]|nr:restriction endonuclease subunit S [Gemmataceae bacterium]
MVGLVADGLGEAYVNQHVAIARPIAAINGRYLAWFLSSEHGGQRQFKALQRGATKAGLGLDDLKAVAVPLPPVGEQGRIVAKVEELISDLDAGVSALERARANLKKYRAAVLRAAVTGELTAGWRAAHPDAEPAAKLLDRILVERRRKWEAEQEARFTATGKALPKNWQSKYPQPCPPGPGPGLPIGWCWATVDQLATRVKNGYFQSPSGASEGHRILRINAVRPMAVNLDEVRFLPSLRGDVSNYYVENGDLLFTRYNGSLALLGVAGLVRNRTAPTIHPDKLIRVVPALPQFLPQYLEVACNVGESRQHMVRRARTTAGQTGVSGGDIKSMPVPLPPLDEQEVILAEVEQRLSAIDAAEAAIDANLKRAARLRQSILKEAFAGRLVPQDPADEPASALLERIRQTRAGADNGDGRRKGRTGVRSGRPRQHES